jgi:hypothetical protein
MLFRSSVESLYRAAGISAVQLWCFLYIYYYIFEISGTQFPNFPVMGFTQLYIPYPIGDFSRHLTTTQCGKFVLCGRDIGRTILMLSIYLPLNFRNLGHAISKLSSQGHYGIRKLHPTLYGCTQGLPRLPARFFNNFIQEYISLTWC